MDDKMIEVIRQIHDRGNSAEVKKRRNDVIVLEVSKKIVYQSDGQNGVR